MSDPLIITINLFGPFRIFSKYFDNSNQVTLQVLPPCTVLDIRHEFNKQLLSNCSDYNENLLAQSFFADDENILSDNHEIKTSTKLCIIPPVCGG